MSYLYRIYLSVGLIYADSKSWMYALVAQDAYKCIYMYIRSRAAVYFYRIGWNKREDDNVDEGIEGEKTRVYSDSSIG